MITRNSQSMNIDRSSMVPGGLAQLMIFQNTITGLKNPILIAKYHQTRALNTRRNI